MDRCPTGAVDQSQVRQAPRVGDCTGRACSAAALIKLIQIGTLTGTATTRLTRNFGSDGYVRNPQWHTS